MKNRSEKKAEREWIRQEPNNPEAWMALAHAEAGWALRELEFNLGRAIGESGSL